MKLLRFVFILFVLGSSVRFVSAQDDITCAQYARTAVLQNEENLAKNIGFSGPKWSSDYDYHYNWCMRVSGDLSQSETMARAIALKQRGADPKCKFSMRIQVRFKNLHVLDEADGSGDAEPYLWLVFFKLDNETITQINVTDPNWVHVPYGGHGNIGTNGGDGWDTNDVIDIPYNIGEWHTDLNLLENVSWDENEQKYGLAVIVIAILLEEDDAPSSNAIATEYHPLFKKTMINKIRNTIAGAPQFWGVLETNKGPIIKIKNDMKSHFIEGFSDPDALYILPILPALVNIDDLIGVEIYRWSWHNLEKNSAQQFETVWNGSTGSEDGDFKLTGEIRGKVICRYIN